MRNWDDSEVRNLKDLPVTNALFDPTESPSQDGIIWFLHRPQNKNWEGPGLSVLSKIPSERERGGEEREGENLSVRTAV